MPEAMELPEHIDRNFLLLLRQEEKFARSLGWAVLEKPEVSVWMILIPILLLHHAHRIQQYRTGLLAFAERILQSKKMALELAREKLRRAGETGSRRAPRPPPGPGSLSADLETPEALTLEEAHAAEMELLEGHYRLLLAQRGASHAELIRKGYPSAGDYRSFLQRLSEAEADVHRAVLASRREDQSAREVVSKMQEAAARLRELEVSLIFG
jgi:hypothetical protein